MLKCKSKHEKNGNLKLKIKNTELYDLDIVNDFKQDTKNTNKPWRKN